MNYTDIIFSKIKEEKIKKIDDLTFRYMLLNTKSYDEVLFIVNKLKFLNVKFSKDMLEYYLWFIEEFEESYSILKELLKYKKIKTNIYTLVLETADNEEQINQVLTEMKRNEVEKFIRFNMVLMTKQKSYRAARVVLENDILTEKYSMERLYKANNDPIKEVFAILFAKAQEIDDLKQIKDELQSVGMSVDIKEYQKYLIKYSKIRTKNVRENSHELEKVCLEVVEKFLNIQNEKKELRSTHSGINSRTTKKVSNNYFRDKSKSDEIKLLYNYCCQICGKPLDVGNAYYSETHHIHPLYLNGSDEYENMINLCPNHHVLFDRGAITIDLINKKVIHVNGTKEELILLEHEINQKYIEYHNKYIFSQKLILSSNFFNKDDMADFGSKVIIQNSITKEENIIIIEDTSNEISYFNYHLLGCKIGDNKTIDNLNYVLLNIIS